MNRTCLCVLNTVAIAVLLAGCGGSFSTLDPAGPSASTIATLWWLMLAGATGLFLLVMVVFVLVVWRPGWGSGLSPARWILLGGLALPAVVLTPLVAYALFAGEQLKPVTGTAELEVEVIARQWSWTFRYPEQGGLTTDGVLHLPAGTPVDILISSEDVIHSFWVPQLAGKMDAIPGRVNRLHLTVSEPGRYQGLCTEFCGTGHASMRFEVVAHPPREYPAVLAEMAQPEESGQP